MSERNESPQYQNKGRGPLWLGAGVLLGSIAAAGITYAVLNSPNNPDYVEPAAVERQVGEMPSHYSPNIEATESVEKVVQASSQSPQKVEGSATPEPLSYQSHEIGGGLLGSFYIISSHFFKLSGYNQNHKISNFNPEYSDAVVRLNKGENIFLEDEYFKYPEYILHEVLDREGFNFSNYGYEMKAGKPTNLYDELLYERRTENGFRDWVEIKEVFKKILNKEELPLLGKFEQNLYDASTERNDYRWYGD